MKNARVHEIFTSIQGEGPWIGQRQIFVRFLGCDIRCRYCDTPSAVLSVDHTGNPLSCSVQIAAGSMLCEQTPNPVPARGLTAFCSRLIVPGPSRPVISLTGGEPLLHASFLEEWLPEVRGVFTVYLETSGIHHDAMEKVRDLVDVVSVDFKLPSATGLRPFWDEHRMFLSAVRGKKHFVKVVVTRDTKADELLASARIIAGCEPSTPLVIQPAGGPLAPDSADLIAFQDAALGIIKDVRVIPQVHTMLNLP